jgi:hypothetical protein
MQYTHKHTHSHKDYYSAIKKNKILSFADKWMELDKPGSERQRSHVSSYMWKIDPKVKCIQKHKHD